ncbi:E3 ubiquitin-protein ligase [Vanrija pseudolonga]|uniref:E3 ubiquitin-protein ligase n=1 Tax=Vanrija pseudolonga TaxID=143232 RepID=A0AAF0Y9W9_9TREE|nr:E3 ubiquitin-protein ligase [Vanrija pseudolonga]
MSSSTPEGGGSGTGTGRPRSPSPAAPDYAPRPAPGTFDEFIAQVDATADAGGSVIVDADLYEEIFARIPVGVGARDAFIASLKRPAAPPQADEACPVCLQSLVSIETEEEYALASEHYFGDTDALGLRALPCPAQHVVCARCAREWLTRNNSCPMCRAVVDPDAPAAPGGTATVIERQRHSEQMLALFQGLFGPRREPPAPRDDSGRESYAGMYS